MSPPASPLSRIAADTNVNPALRAVLANIDAAFAGQSPKPAPSEDAAARMLWDELVEGPLYDALAAIDALKQRAEVVARQTRGTVAGARAASVSHSASHLLRATVARPLLEARTFAREADDAACSAATEASLRLAYERDPAGFGGE